MRTYPVRVVLEGKWWVARATGFEHAVTQARRWSDVEGAARDMIAALEGVPIADVVVDMSWERVGEVDIVDVGHAVERDRALAETAQQRYRERLRTESRRLADNGLAVRDIGAILSLSHQRVQQLLSASATAGASSPDGSGGAR